MEALNLFYPIAIGAAVFMFALMLSSAAVSFFAQVLNPDQYDDMYSDMVEKW